MMALVCSPQQVIDVQSERDGVGGGGQGLRGSHDQSKKVRVRSVTVEACQGNRKHWHQPAPI